MPVPECNIHNTTWCDFCVALDVYSNAGSTPEYLKAAGDNARNRELLRTESFRVIVALGPITEGNLLIIPTRHMYSLAELSASEMNELLSLRRLLKSILTKVYGTAMFFEHGFTIEAEKQNPDGCSCIDHAHLHVVPCALDLLPSIEERYPGHHLQDYRDLRMLKLDQYIYYEGDEGTPWVFVVDAIEHQFLRKIAFAALGKPGEWNWRHYPNLEAMDRTLDVLAPYMSQGAFVESSERI